MPETVHKTAPAARLTLFGYRSVPANVELVERPRSVRLPRAILSLALCWSLAPIVFIVPPHFPWALIAFCAGIYLAWNNARGTHEVHSFQATCPSCGGTLTIKPGTRIRFPHKLVCYGCHHEPFLEIANPPD